MITNDIAQIQNYRSAHAQNSDQLQSKNTSNTQDQLSFNKDAYMKMFLAQLEHQGLNPNAKTEDLVTQTFIMSQSEQQAETNKYLKQMRDNLSEGKASNIIGYLNQNVEYSNATQDFLGGDVSFKYNLANNAKNVRIIILDEKNNIIKTDKMSGNKGLNNYVWNGTNNNDDTVVPGKYRININATNNLGATIQSSSNVTSKVTTIHNVQGEPIIELENGDKISLARIESLLNNDNK